MISFERVRHDNPTAGKLLQLWAYLHYQDIWYELFLRSAGSWHDEQGWVQELAGGEIVFKGTMQSLLAYSLIESQQDRESYSMHPVVHDWCAETVSCGHEDLLLAALIIVGRASPDHSEAEYWLLQQRLLPHADRCVRQMGVAEAHHYLQVEASDAFHGLGILFADQGKYAKAEKMNRRALDGREKAWGPDHTSTLSIVNNLASLYVDQGKHAKAEEMYRRALDGYIRARGRNHPITQRIANNLALLHQQATPRRGKIHKWLCKLKQ